jgi:hypothetical protein
MVGACIIKVLYTVRTADAKGCPDLRLVGSLPRRWFTTPIIVAIQKNAKVGTGVRPMNPES